MTSDSKKILLIGYGNPGRLDDGLGPALAARIEAGAIKGISVDADYQLTMENAFDISSYDIVIFADAAVKGEDPFIFKEIHSQQAMSFSSHSVSPETVLFCAEKMFNARTKAYLLGIRGYEFGEFEERLSERAERNLEEAFEFVVDFISPQRRKEFTDR